MPSDYASNLTRDQWELLVPLIPDPKATGRPRTVDLYAVVNAILYVLVTGCAWSLLPKDFSPYSTVYYCFCFSGKPFFKTGIDWMAMVLEVVLRPKSAQGFFLLSRRWVVERTHGRLHWCRRVNVDYERWPESSEAFIHIAMIRLMLQRLA